METRKVAREPEFVPAPDWVRRLAHETTAFQVVSVIDGQSTGVWDSIITLSVPPDDRRVALYVLTRSQLSPQTTLSILRDRQSVPPTETMLICCPHISQRIAELCREQGVAYLDGVGNCHIAAPGLLVHVGGRQNRPSSIKPAADPFSRKSSRIVRILLTHPEKGWQVQQLAQEAGVSLGLASKVKTALVEDAYLEQRDRLVYLRDPAKLLQGWAAQYRPHVKRLQLFTLNSPPESERLIAAWCRSNEINHALTQLSAAWRYSPMVRYNKSVVYVDKKVISEGKLPSLLDHLEARRVDTGVNCTLWITDDPAVFSGARDVDGTTIVSPIQLYLDLKTLAGRGEEAALEVLQKELPSLLPGTHQTYEPTERGQK